MGHLVALRSPGGHDLLVGQNGEPGAGRARNCVIITRGRLKNGRFTRRFLRTLHGLFGRTS